MEQNVDSFCSFDNVGEEELKSIDYIPVLLEKEPCLSQEEWDKIMTKNISNLEPSERRLIGISLLKGILPHLRNKIWLYLVNTENLVFNFNKNFYQKLLNIHNNKLENTIKKDIERTFSILKNKQHIENLNGLKQKFLNVLKAYAVFDSEIGYAQGTNFIVLMLILNIEKEIDVFWVFMDIMVNKNWKNIYIPNSSFLMTNLGVVQKKIKNRFPRLYEHFKNENVNKYNINNTLQYLLIFSSGNSFQEQCLLFFRHFSFMKLLLNIVKDSLIYSLYIKKLS